MSRGTLKVATYNVCALRPKLSALLDWLDREDPDLLGLQETKVSDAEFPRAAFESRGWHVAFHGQKGHHGVAFVAKKPLQSVECRLYPNDDCEDARFIRCVYDGLPVFNTYIPQGTAVDSPRFQSKLKFLSDLRRFFDARLTPETPALWLGDMNVAQEGIDLARPAGNRDHVCFHADARAAFAAAKDGLWLDLFREKFPEPGHYTFWSMRFPNLFEKNIGWRVDLILGTRPMLSRLKKIRIDRDARALKNCSDHTFVIAEFSRE